MNTRAMLRRDALVAYAQELAESQESGPPLAAARTNGVLLAPIGDVSPVCACRRAASRVRKRTPHAIRLLSRS